VKSRCIKNSGKVVRGNNRQKIYIVYEKTKVDSMDQHLLILVRTFRSFFARILQYDLMLRTKQLFVSSLGTKSTMKALPSEGHGVKKSITKIALKEQAIEEGLRKKLCLNDIFRSSKKRTF